jgi:hypothetical protein
MLERDIEQYLVEQVETRGGQAHKIKFIGRRGAPDRLVIMPGWGSASVWLIELKRPGGRLSPAQTMFKDGLPMGARYAVLWSIEDVDRWLESL